MRRTKKTTAAVMPSVLEIPPAALNAVHVLRLANDVRITFVTILPRHVTYDCDRMGVATGSFFRSESAAQNRPHAERVEIIRGHHSSDRTLGAVAIAQRCASDFIDDERLEQGRVFFEIEEVGIRKSSETLSAPGRAVEREHSILVRDERIGADENPFDPT